MKVTFEWLAANTNGPDDGIAINARQLRILGLEWPPRKGWVSDIIGTVLTDEQAEAFVKARKKRKDETKKDLFGPPALSRRVPKVNPSEVTARAWDLCSRYHNYEYAFDHAGYPVAVKDLGPTRENHDPPW